eukprot:g8100.t1
MLQESAYWNSLQESDTLLRLCGELAQDTERREAVDACVERLCQLCWAEALEAVDCHTLLIAARAEVDHLKRRLSQMNLMSLGEGLALRPAISASPSWPSRPVSTRRPQLKWTIGARSIRGEGLRCRKGVQPKKCCGNHAWIWRAAVYIHSTLNALPHSQTSNEQLSK